MRTFYETLAAWWPWISPLEDYESEMQQVIRLIEARSPSARTMLELGSGGGHNAYYLKQRYAMTLTDIHEAMLSQSKRLNPDCEHVQGDMRTLALATTFDLVFAHDAIDYITSEADLDLVARNAHRHLRPGGLFVCMPDHVRERFEPGTECGGSDSDDGHAIRYLEWTPEVVPGATTSTTVYSFVAREADGTLRSFVEEHVCGLFPEATWVAILERAGFAVEVLDEMDVEDERTPRRIFCARRDAAS
jgi:SAM-dependent methyltransferase